MLNKEQQQFMYLMRGLQNVLYKYITEINHDKVWNILAKFLTNEDVVLITKAQFKRYVELEKTVLEKFPLPNIINGE